MPVRNWFVPHRRHAQPLLLPDAARHETNHGSPRFSPKRSCQMRCLWFMRGGILVVETQKSVKRGQELTVAYLPTTGTCEAGQRKSQPVRRCLSGPEEALAQGGEWVSSRLRRMAFAFSLPGPSSARHSSQSARPSASPASAGAAARRAGQKSPQGRAATFW